MVDGVVGAHLGQCVHGAGQDVQAPWRRCRHHNATARPTRRAPGGRRRGSCRPGATTARPAADAAQDALVQRQHRGLAQVLLDKVDDPGLAQRIEVIEEGARRPGGVHAAGLRTGRRRPWGRACSRGRDPSAHTTARSRTPTLPVGPARSHRRPGRCWPAGRRPPPRPTGLARSGSHGVGRPTRDARGEGLRPTPPGPDGDPGTDRLRWAASPLPTSASGGCRRRPGAEAGPCARRDRDHARRGGAGQGSGPPPGTDPPVRARPLPSECGPSRGRRRHRG